MSEATQDDIDNGSNSDDNIVIGAPITNTYEHRASKNQTDKVQNQFVDGIARGMTLRRYT